MTDQAISPLRRRMIEDMTVRMFAPKTQQLCVKGQGLRRVSRPAPRVAKLEDVRRYRLHLKKLKPGASQVIRRGQAFDPRPAPE
jgi:integrase/recombinase XerD